MTDKEIIIGGVDVSKCSYGELEKAIFKCSCEYNVRSASMFCKDNPNCYFKQLKRKEQEVNKYKQALNEIEDVADDYNRVEKTSQYYRDGFDEIQDIINEVKE